MQLSRVSCRLTFTAHEVGLSIKPYPPAQRWQRTKLDGMLLLLCTGAHYAHAVAGYTRAIALDPNNAVYYANRAFAHLRLENLGSVLTDATKAIELDPTYAKVCSSLSHGDHQGFALNLRLLILCHVHCSYAV